MRTSTARCSTEKFEEGSLQLVAVGELGEIVARLLPFDREFRQLDHAPARSPGVVTTGVDEEAVQPGVEGTGVAQTPDLAPGLHECVLNGICLLYTSPSPRDS